MSSKEILRALVLIMLAFPAAADIRCKKFAILPPFLFFAAALALRLASQDCPLPELAAGALPGAGFLLLSRLSQGALGLGDAVLILFLGIICGFWEVFSILLLALTLSAAAGLFLMWKEKSGRKRQIPFVPFLLVAYIIFCFGGDVL